MTDWLTGAPMDPTATPAEPLPALPGFPFLIAATAAIIVGPTGAGRSSLFQAAMYDAAAHRVRCAYLGHEVTQPEFNARAADLARRRNDALDRELLDQLQLVRYLELTTVIPHGWQHPAAWTEGIVALYDVVGIDPLSAVASALDLDFDQRNTEFVRFYDRLIAPLTRAGVTVVMADNLGHAQEARTRAKGVSAKQDRADLTFSCAISSNPVGLILRAQKVRSVRAPFKRGDEWLFTRDDQRIAHRGHTPDSTGHTFRPTTLMQAASEAIEANPGLTRNAIRTTVKGRAEYVDLALELLIAEGHVEVSRDGQARRHTSLKPYRVPTESNQVPDPVPGTGSNRVPHPSVGGGDSGPGSGDPGLTDRVPQLDLAPEWAEHLAAQHGDDQ